MKKPWSSSSKWFVPFHLAIMASIFAGLMLFSMYANAKATGESDRVCLAQNIYFESGNQPFSGKLAVANVTLNRVDSSQFPDSICEVVYQTKKWKTNWRGEAVPVIGQCQFSWFCDGKSDEPKDSATWLEAIRVADVAISTSNFDITNGALYYHADYIVPYWAEHLERLVQIENHIFYK